MRLELGAVLTPSRVLFAITGMTAKRPVRPVDGVVAAVAVDVINVQRFALA
jgi:hypothetical protein